MPGGGALGRLRHRRLAALASLASATTEAQTAAARTELERSRSTPSSRTTVRAAGS